MFLCCDVSIRKWCSSMPFIIASHSQQQHSSCSHSRSLATRWLEVALDYTHTHSLTHNLRSKSTTHQTVYYDDDDDDEIYRWLRCSFGSSSSKAPSHLGWVCMCMCSLGAFWLLWLCGKYIICDSVCWL